MATGLRLRPRGVALLASLAGGLVLCAAAVSACSGGSPGYAQSSSGAPPKGDASTSAEGGTLPSPQPDLCKGGVLGPQAIAELTQVGSPPPPIGGAIAVGTYDLAELNVYRTADAGADSGEGPPGEGLSGRSGNATLVVTTNTLAFIEAYGKTGALDPAAPSGYAYSAAGTAISAAKVCPETVATKGIPYSAVGDSLALFVDPAHREVFRRRP